MSRHPEKEPPKLKGGLPLIGHLIPFAAHPHTFLQRAYREGGEVVTFKILNSRIFLLSGAASHAFFHSSEEQLDQSSAYALMKPLFGPGVLFSASTARKAEQIRMMSQSLHIEAIRQRAAIIVAETKALIANWGEEGEIELVTSIRKLTLSIAIHCFLGAHFRQHRLEEFEAIYHDLSQGIRPLAYFCPNLPLPAFRKRDRALACFQKLVADMVAERKEAARGADDDDMLQFLMTSRYQDGSSLTPNEMAGMMLANVFAGHHTTTALVAWILVELLKHPLIMRQVKQEIDQGQLTHEPNRTLFDDHSAFHRVVKETLRLHPSLILLMRVVKQELVVGPYRIPSGALVWTSPAVNQKIPQYFPHPETFDPDRYSAGLTEEQAAVYHPFGGGKHKCCGRTFALLNVEMIFSVLLRDYEFELVDPPHSYVSDYGQMMSQPKHPCRVRYRQRAGGKPTAPAATDQKAAGSACPFQPQKSAPPTYRVVLDRQVCQGFGDCKDAAPEIFDIDRGGKAFVLQPRITDQLLSKARDAAKRCPTCAITVTKES